jgi:hypothetical protein
MVGRSPSHFVGESGNLESANGDLIDVKNDKLGPTNRARFRVLRVALGLLVSSLIAVVLAVWLVNRYVVFSIEEGRSQPSVAMRTPFGVFSPGSSKGSQSLWNVVYPKSEWDEQIDTHYYRGAAGTGAQLTVLRFRTRVPLAIVDDWYARKLGMNYSRNKGWTLTPNDDGEQRWLRQVRKNSDPDVLTYQQKLVGRVRGVMLEPELDGNGVLITLYDFQELGD